MRYRVQLRNVLRTGGLERNQEFFICSSGAFLDLDGTSRAFQLQSRVLNIRRGKPFEVPDENGTGGMTLFEGPAGLVAAGELRCIEDDSTQRDWAKKVAKVSGRIDVESEWAKVASSLVEGALPFLGAVRKFGNTLAAILGFAGHDDLISTFEWQVEGKRIKTSDCCYQVPALGDRAVIVLETKKLALTLEVIGMEASADA